MSMLEELEGDFAKLLTQMATKCNSIPELSGDEKDRQIKAGEKDVADGQDLLEQIELEIADLPSSKRSAAKASFSTHKRELSDAERKLRKAAVALSAKSARDELFEFDGSTDDAREALIGNTERLDRTSNRLDDGQRAALEAQEVGMGILDNLTTQRETIERSRSRLKEANTPLARSMRILKGMHARALQNRAITAALVFFLVIIIIIVVILIMSK